MVDTRDLCELFDTCVWLLPPRQKIGLVNPSNCQRGNDFSLLGGFCYRLDKKSAFWRIPRVKAAI